MMTAARPRQGLVPVLATTAVGVGAAWLAATPLGLLAPIAALFLYTRGLAATLLLAALALAFVGAMAGVILLADNARDLAAAWAVLFAAGICIGAALAIRPVDATDGEVLDGRALSHVHPDDRAAAEQATARAFRSGVVQIITCRLRQPDGTYRRAEFRAEPGYRVSVPVDPMIHDPDAPWTIVGSLGETTEAVRAAHVIEALHGAAFAFDASGTFTYATPVAQTSIGMTLDDLNRPLGGGAFIDGGDFGWKLGVHPDDYEAAAAQLRHCLRTGEHYNCEYRVRRATGEYVWHRFAIRPTRNDSGRITGWYGIGFDIDVYTKTEAALRARERELSQLVDMVPSHLWRLAPGGEPIFFNRRMVDFLGLDVTDLDRPGVTRLEALLESVHPDDAVRFRETLGSSIATGQNFALRYRLRRADGVYRWMSSRAEPTRGEDGRVLQWYGLCHDMDDQMQAEDALRESERSLRQLIETLPALIYCAKPDGEPVYRSQQLRQFLGFDRESQPGQSPLAATLATIIHPDDLPTVRERYGHSLATGEPYALRHRLRRFDGVYRWVETRTAAMRNAEGTIVQWNGVCFDIEDQIRAQEELRLAQERLAGATQAASLAELSASIAHEVNQPLAAIVANSYACERWLTADPPNLERAQKTVERVIRDANAAADIVSRIRALFKQSTTGKRTATMLGGVLAEARDLMADEAARRAVRMDVELEGEPVPVAIDRVQVQQVLINLIRNGMEAMEAAASDKVIRLRVRRLGDFVQTEVSDRGPGVDRPDSIFEPFFTTKGNGMGMGLAICRSIVESHGGRLWVEPAEPQGATFIFTLPVAEAAAS